MLTYYDPKRQIVVSADTISIGLGVALFQLEGDELKSVGYIALRLLMTQRKYAKIKSAW